MWLGLILCYLATFSFGILFNVPLRALYIGALVGCFSWITFQALPQLGVSIILATAIASLLSATVSHFLAKRFRIPVTNFTIPAIIPLVPGSKAYFTMRAFVEREYLLGLELGIDTMFQAGAIAAGLVFALSVFSFKKGGIGHRYEPNR
ncbi:threonine/serine exporter family protein [Bacillus alkalicellulosilyticus]|uniref:threonine/serine exporter family protein n=1 Tax=Alkalihalobacterium alkalicellulosilyticum TaxID=1912214 RepID=UPI00099729AB|nr:threonine/serine exporter family protein [Bacillus alkalicellulosilyticus]